MIRVHVPEWVRIIKKAFYPVTPKLIFFVIIFNHDVRPIKLENTAHGSRIVLGMFRGIEPMKVGTISIDYHIDQRLTCIQTEPLFSEGRVFTLVKGYLALTEQIQISSSQVSGNKNNPQN